MKSHQITSYHIKKFRDLRHSQTISDPFRISLDLYGSHQTFRAPGSPRPPPWHIDRCPVLDWSPPAASLPSGGFSGDVTQKISKFSSGSLWRQHGAHTWLINLQQGRGSFRAHCYNAAGWTKNTQNLPRCREMSDAGRKRPQRSKSAGEHLPHHMSLTSFQQGPKWYLDWRIFFGDNISYLYILFATLWQISLVLLFGSCWVGSLLQSLVALS